MSIENFLNLKVSDCVGRRGVRGDLFGVEGEFEGKRVDAAILNSKIPLQGWEHHRDGSLRDHHGSSAEWVFHNPCSLEEAITRVHNLFDVMEERKAGIVCSNRTSIHVHFNMGDKQVFQVFNLFILFTVFESVLSRFCGEDRNGNLFCLSSCHAEHLVQMVENALRDQSFGGFHNDLRYSSLNLCSLHKFASVEFRGMRGVDNREDLLAWLGIVNDLCKYACYTMKSPSAIMETISFDTPVGFMRTVFSEASFTYLMGCNTQEQVHESVYNGLRLVQRLSYRIGAVFNKVIPIGKDFWEEVREAQAVAPPPAQLDNAAERELDIRMRALAAQQHLRDRAAMIARDRAIARNNAAARNAVNEGLGDNRMFRVPPPINPIPGEHILEPDWIQRILNQNDIDVD